MQQISSISIKEMFCSNTFSSLKTQSPQMIYQHKLKTSAFRIIKQPHLLKLQINLTHCLSMKG